jgi:hypothetical protein
VLDSIGKGVADQVGGLLWGTEDGLSDGADETPGNNATAAN